MRMVREDVLNCIFDDLTEGDNASFTGAALSRCTYSYNAAPCRMGRRVTKTTTQPDTNTTRAEAFVYNGYLQVANKSIISNQTTQQFYIWDPTEPVATRPLVWNREGNETAFYLHDGNKNVSDVISASGEVLAHYTYAPFGDCTAFGSSALSNPWRFSSEYADDELGCVYYNYREYESMMGRWISLEPICDKQVLNLYQFEVDSISGTDYLGLTVLDEYKQKIFEYIESLKHLLKGIKVGLKVRSWFIENNDAYKCCPEGAYKSVGLDKYDGVLNGTKSSWTIARRITGCELRAAGLTFEDVCALNSYHETFEFFRPWRPEFLSFMDTELVEDFTTLVQQINSSIKEYLEDTVLDISAVMEGFGVSGEDCYSKFIPEECKREVRER